MTVTTEIARFVAETPSRSVPDDVREFARLMVLNIVGVALAGRQTRTGRLHCDLAREFGGGVGHARILGDQAPVSAPWAAYANANLGFALDYEDMFRYVVHPGHAVVAASLAAGERVGASGREVIDAVTLAAEAVNRIALSMQPGAERGAQVWGEQYHPFAAALAAGRLLRLDGYRMEVALGAAGVYATVPSAYKYFGVVADTRPMREVKLGWGWMCMGGVTAAFSAARGFGGGLGVLDGPHGFWIMAGSDRFDPAPIVEGLGRAWVLPETEFKIHPSIAWNHPAHQAARMIAAEPAFEPASVKRVRITSMQADKLEDAKVAGEVDGQFSLPYTVATTLLKFPLDATLYADSTRLDPRVRALLAVTDCVPDREADDLWFREQRMRSRVAVELHGGVIVEKQCEFPRDRPHWGAAEVEQKFIEVAAAVIGRETAAGLAAAVHAMDDDVPVAKLLDLAASRDR